MDGVAPTPFLPDGRQVFWNSVSLGLAKDCSRKYKLAFLDGWNPQGTGVHLVFGSHYAKVLERFHKKRAEGLEYDTARFYVIKQCIDETYGWISDHPSKNRPNLIRSIIWYLEEYRNDPCETVILADGSPAVELKFEMPLTSEITLVGHLDRLVTYAGGVYVQDQKTSGATIGAYWFNRFNPDNQMSLYSVASKVVYKTPVLGVMIDAAQIAVGFTRFSRGFTYRTEEQCEEWLKDAEYHIEQIWAAEAHGWPMRDTACQKYGGCQFLNVCSKDPRVREEYLKSDFEIKHHNPLALR